MKVKITSWQAVATWRWNLREDDDTCGICQVAFDATCPRCRFPGDGCPLVHGDCQHTFHRHCLDQWLTEPSAQGRCPMCRQDFKEHGVAITRAEEPAPQSDAAPAA